MELNTIQRLIRLAYRSNRNRSARCINLKRLRCLDHVASMANPDRLLCWCVFKQTGIVVYGQTRLFILSISRLFNVSTILLSDKLHPITNAQNQKTLNENERIIEMAIVIIDIIQSSGKDNSFRIHGLNFFRS